ncbi:MAG: hypothetical protein ACTSXK_04380 [Promethearchaeota archaeon]
MSSPEQKQKNRYRLLLLLVIYPIYETIHNFLVNNFAWAVIFLIISIMYVAVLIYTFYKIRNQNNW